MKLFKLKSISIFFFCSCSCCHCMACFVGLIALDFLKAKYFWKKVSIFALGQVADLAALRETGVGELSLRSLV